MDKSMPTYLHRYLTGGGAGSDAGVGVLVPTRL